MPSQIQLLGTTGQRDTTGAISIVTRFLCPDLTSAKTLMINGISRGNSIPGVFTANLSQDETGQFIVGISTDEIAPQGTPASVGGIGELDFSLTQEKINTHPNFFPTGGLKETYGWQDDGSGGGSFPATMPASTTTNGTQKNKATTTANPLYNRDTWWAPGLIYMVTRTLETCPSDVFQNIGAIDEPRQAEYGVKLPTRFVNRNWLKMAPQVSVRNSVVQIVEKWQLSPPGGWLEPVYGVSAIQVASK